MDVMARVASPLVSQRAPSHGSSHDEWCRPGRSGACSTSRWIWRHRAPLLILGSDLGASVRANGRGDTTVAPLTAHLRGGNDTAEGGASDDYVDGGDGDDRGDLGGGTNTCVDVEQGGC